MARILVVEDEGTIADAVLYALRADGMQSEHCLLGREALQRLRVEAWDVLILDVGLPDLTGFELCRELRAFSDIPVIFLTARASEIDRVLGLELGADDYVVKPFSPRELVARIRALLRRTAPAAAESPIEISGLELDPLARRVRAHGRAVSMGPTEFRLLYFLMSHPDRAWSRTQLLDHVWGANVYIDERTVDVHVRRLRKALEPANDAEFDCGRLVQTVRGTGYRFSAQLDGG